MSKINEAFDYIVVGLGTSGCAIAKFLSDDMETSVLAIHNGQDLDTDKQIALAANIIPTVSSALSGSNYFTTGNTIGQKNINNRQMLWVVANPVGGASSINGSIYCRPSNYTLDKWEKISGSFWSKEKILDIACRLENYKGETSNEELRGFNGPLNIRQAQEVTPFGNKLTKAISDALNIPIVLDYNDPNCPISATNFVQYCQKGPNGNFRVCSSMAFLNSEVMTPDGIGVGSRKLKVLFDTLGVRALFSDNNATAIEYLEDGIIKTAYAKKGIIISGGLFSSPFLLRSGIGSKKLLHSLNIPVVFDNSNVGKNLSDHYYLPFVFKTNAADTPISHLNPNNFINQIAFLPDDQGNRQSIVVSINIDIGVVMIALSLSPTYSRGEITINSKDPLEMPVIDINIFSDKRDLDNLTKIIGVQIKKIVEQLKSIDSNCQLIDPKPDLLDNVDAITELIKERVLCYQEFQGHCKMAPLDQGGVVDGNCQVFGVNNLYVVDNSIIPSSTDCGSMSPAYYIAINFCERLLNRKVV